MEQKQDKDNQPERLMPVLQSDRYLPAVQKGGITAEDKVKFLDAYYKSGNQAAAGKLIGRSGTSMRGAMATDKAFLEDFSAIKLAMRNNLEQTMYQNGLKEKGYMDRITWLRTNFPADYNPNYQEKEHSSEELIKDLTSKLETYTMIPKKSIIEVKEGPDAA